MGSEKNMDLKKSLGCTMKGQKIKIWGLRPTDKEADQLLSYQIDLRIHEGLITTEGENQRWKSKNTSRIKSKQSERKV